MRFSLLLLLLLSLPLLPQAKSETIRSPTRSGSHARGRAAQEEQSQWEFSSPSTEGRKRKKKGPELSARLQEAFGSRPVWSSLALRNVLASSREAIRQALPGVAYRMRDGPFKSLWVRRGFDPSSEPSSFMYQMYPLQLQRFEQQVASKLLGNKPRRSDHRLLEVPWRAVTVLQLVDIQEPQMERLLLNASSSCRYFDEERGWLTDEAWAQIKAIIETRKFELLRVCSPLVASPRVSPMRKRSQQAIPSSPAKRTLSSPASPRGRTLASPSPSLPLLRALGGDRGLAFLLGLLLREGLTHRLLLPLLLPVALLLSRGEAFSSMWVRLREGAGEPLTPRKLNSKGAKQITSSKEGGEGGGGGGQPGWQKLLLSILGVTAIVCVV